VSQRRRSLGVRLEVGDWQSFAKRIGAALPESEHMHSPRAFDIQSSPFTAEIIEVFPEYAEVLGTIKAREENFKWSTMDADQKAFDMPIMAAAREVNVREAKKADRDEA